MHDIAAQRIRREGEPLASSTAIFVDGIISAAAGSDLPALIEAEYRRLGVPEGCLFAEASLILGLVGGKILSGGAELVQAMAFFRNVASRELTQEDNIVLPGVTDIEQQLRWSRLMNAAIWEFFYEISATGVIEDLDKRWEVSVAAAGFQLEMSLILLTST